MVIPTEFMRWKRGEIGEIVQGIDGYVRIVDTFSVSDSMVLEMTYDIYDDVSYANFDFES